MSYGYGYGGGTALAVLLTVYLVVIGTVLLIAIAVYLLMGFSFMKLFRKVGIEPWAAWVPFFNTWRILELGGQPGWVSIFQVIPYANYVPLVFECIGAYKTGVAFRKDGSWVVLFIFFPYIWAWMLAADGLPYEPELISQRGFKPPLIGYGSARGPYVPPTPPPSA
jgi:hypothetical protein